MIILKSADKDYYGISGGAENTSSVDRQEGQIRRATTSIIGYLDK